MDTKTTPTGPPEKPQYWAVIPANVRYDPELPAAAKLLYAEISSLTDRTGFCFASNAYFMALFEESERTLQRHFKSLEARGYIRIADGSGGAGRRRIYAGINPLFTNPDKNDGVTPTKMTGPPDKNDAHNSKENKKENNPPKAPQGAGADYVPKKEPKWKPERFKSFWNFYPLHKSKQDAIKAWDKLKPSDELLAVIGRALKRQIAEKEQHGDPWKIYASTYLNSARWTDEVESAAAPRSASETPPGGRKDLVLL